MCTVGRVQYTIDHSLDGKAAFVYVTNRASGSGGLLARCGHLMHRIAWDYERAGGEVLLCVYVCM